ncbi:MAG: UvrD-helicase domain-containing protein [Syntrophomonadaceae bacterium]
MSKADLQDSEARAQIGNRLDVNMFVEAGAGSGKTASLVRRMLALVRTGACTVDQIAAITFTRKAAGELSQRLQLEMEKAVQAEPDSAARQRLEQGLTNLNRCFTGTIHSFCAALLRERPVEAGLAPDFIEIEGLDEQLLEKKAWEEYLSNLNIDAPHRIRGMQRLDLSPPQLFEAYRKLNLYPDVEKVRQPAPFPVISPEARQRLQGLVRLARPYLPASEPEKGWDRLQAKIRRIIFKQRIEDLNDDFNLLRLYTELNRSKAICTQNRWLSRDGAKDVNAAWGLFNHQFVQPVLRQWKEYRYYEVMEFLLPACQYYDDMRAAENCLNFQDLLMRSARLLRDNPEVRRYYQQRWSRLLVDEFQDTDPVQAQIMLYLTGADCRQPDWSRLLPAPGSLFVVGDPKQSIYRFRRADINVFHQMRQIIIDSGGEVVTLSSNFRSLPEIMEWINPCFEDYFALMDPPYQADYVSMEAVRSEPSQPGSGVAVIELESDDKPENDAARIAGWIKGALNGSLALSRSPEGEEAGLDKNPVPGDFLILLHYKKDMAAYARALESIGIPYQITGASDLSASFYNQELLLLLRAVADPHNPVALVSCLRGLFFGLSDQSLYEYKVAGGNFSLLAPVPEELDEPVRSQLVGAYEKLQDYYRCSQDLPPAVTLERVIDDSGLLPLAAAQELGKSQAAAVVQLLEAVRRQQDQGFYSFGAMVDFVDTLLEAGAEDELSLEGIDNRRVRLMNLHKAKGLEAPVVILANPWHNVVHEPDFHVSRQAQEQQAHLVISRKVGEHNSEVLAQPASWEAYCAEESQYQDAEKVRLLYVAATRARNLLVVVTNDGKPVKSPWYPLEKYLMEAARLDIPIDTDPAPLLPGSDVAPEIVVDMRQRVKADWEQAGVPSYMTANVSTLTKAGQEAPQGYANGKGMSWGSVIHKALEQLAQGSGDLDDPVWLGRLLTDESRPAEEVPELKETLIKITSAPFWQRLQTAAKVMTEVPFGIFEGQTYLTGTIDLIFRENGEWVLIDYKTDAIRDDDHLRQLKDYYWPQVEVYKNSWQKITGEPVKEIGLFFTERLAYQSGG